MINIFLYLHFVIFCETFADETLNCIKSEINFVEDMPKHWNQYILKFLHVSKGKLFAGTSLGSTCKNFILILKLYLERSKLWGMNSRKFIFKVSFRGYYSDDYKMDRLVVPSPGIMQEYYNIAWTAACVGCSARLLFTHSWSDR